MKGYSYYAVRGVVLAIGLVYLFLIACGSDETADAPAEAMDPDIADIIEEAEPAEVGSGGQPTATAAAVAPTPDFGSIIYDVPQEMVRAEEVQIILLVSPSEEVDLRAALEAELAEVGQEPGNVTEATVKVAKRMSASLTSAPSDAFEIVPLQAADEQPIREDEPTQWEWTVVPLLGGTHRLILRIDRLVERDGVSELLKEEVHRDDVTVDVPVSMRLQDAWGSFDIKWLAGVFIFPLFFYILSRRDGSKEKNEG